MADVSDVENALVSLIAQALYPNGTGQPSSIGGAPCRVYRGWPPPGQLDADCPAGVLNVSVFPMEVEQNTTRYPINYRVAQQAATPSLTLTVSGNTVTVGGVVSSPLNAAVLVNRKGFIYGVQATDTTTTIATALANLINASVPATSSGPVITIGGAVGSVLARVGGVGTIIRELKRQRRSFQITIWASSPAQRDAAGAVLDPALAAYSFISLPDGTGGRIRYERSITDDVPQRELLWRRDLIYSVEYATTQSQSAAEILVQIFNISGGLDPNNPPVISFDI